MVKLSANSLMDVRQATMGVLAQPHFGNVDFCSNAARSVFDAAADGKYKSRKDAISALERVNTASKAFFGALLLGSGAASRTVEKFKITVTSLNIPYELKESYIVAYRNYQNCGFEFGACNYESDSVALGIANTYGCRPGNTSESARVLEIIYQITNPTGNLPQKTKQHSALNGDAPNSGNRQAPIVVEAQQTEYMVSLRKIEGIEENLIDVLFVKESGNYRDVLGRIYVGETTTGEFMPFRRAIFRCFRLDNAVVEAVVFDGGELYHVKRLPRVRNPKRDVYRVVQLDDAVLDTHAFNELSSGIVDGRIRFFSNLWNDSRSVKDLLVSLMPYEDALNLSYLVAAYKLDHRE